MMMMMGISLEEEKLVKMVDDFIESAAETPPIISSCSSNYSLPGLISKTTHNYVFNLKEILGSGRKAERKVGEAVMKQLMRRPKLSTDAPKTTNLNKWLVMNLRMEGYDSCNIYHTSWVTSMGCPAGDYEYIEMEVESDDDDELGSGVKRVIIDIDFRAQFEIARATEEYKQLTQALPSVFVGTEDMVSRIIKLLCSAAKHSLKESGLHIPPWRTSTYMHSKWLSPHQNNNFNFNFQKSHPPMVLVINQIRKSVWGGASALSTQFSNISINCC